MPKTPVPPSQIPANQIEEERRQLENLRSRLQYENELVFTLQSHLEIEIADKENAAREILKSTSPDNPQDAYDRQLATEALEDLVEKTDERLVSLRILLFRPRGYFGGSFIFETVAGAQLLHHGMVQARSRSAERANNKARYVMPAPTHLALLSRDLRSLCSREQGDLARLSFTRRVERINRTAELALYAGEGHVPGEKSLVKAVDASRRMLDS
jgi:hypothetical protein